ASAADGLAPQAQLEAIERRVRELAAQARECLHERLLPALDERGIRLVRMSDLTSSEWNAVDLFFESEVFPVLTPLAVDPGHPFPYVSNLSLSLAVELYDPERSVERFARVKVPKSIPRWVGFGRDRQFIPLEKVIGANLDALFPGVEIRGYYAFRVTRYSDLELPNFDEDDDLLAMIEEQVFQRRFAEVVRVEVQDGMPTHLRKLLLDELQEDQPPEMPPLTESEVVENGPLLELGDPPYNAHTPPELRDPTRPIFDVLREKNILVHHPFDSFATSVESFITSAVADDNVLAIKM